MSQTIIRWITTHAALIAACFLLLGGSAYAASLITGADVKDGSLTGADVRDGSLTAADLSPSAASAATRGRRGPRGPRGRRGLRGPQGAPGPAGAQGPAGPAGASGLAGKRFVTAANGPSSDETREVTAVCPPGTIVMSGTAEVTRVAGNSQPQAYLTASRPATGQEGWTATAREDLAGFDSAWTLTAQALCTTP